MKPALLALAFLTAVSTLLAEEPFALDRTPGRLPKDVLPHHYRVRFEADIETATIRGTEQIEIEVRKPTRRIVLHALGLEISRAALSTSGTKATPLTARIDAPNQTLTLEPPRELAPGRYELELEFSGKLSEQPQGLFITRYKAGDIEKRALASQMQAPDARRMFPCWDEPVFRAAFEFTAIVPAKHTAVSNMPIVREQPIDGGRKEVRFAPTPSMSSYLVGFAAGEFETLEDEVDGVRLRIITTEGKREHGRYALDATKKLLPYFNEYFGTRYPLPKLDQFCFPGFPSGGMENWGAIFYNDTTLLVEEESASQNQRERVFGIVAHEIAHQWFGNLVTTAWWDNLWLNEGFASWMGTKATDHFNPGWQMWLRAAGDKEEAMRLDARATTHPIQQPIADEHAANDAFDEITYSKGQSILRMLEAWLGEAEFRAGIRAYMQKHAYGSTTTADLWAALESASGKAVGDFAAGWTEQPGFPVVKLGDVEPGQLELTQERFTIHQMAALPLTWKVPVTYASISAMEATRVVLLGASAQALPALPDSSPAKLNAGAAGYYRVDYGRHFEALKASVPSLPEADRLNLLQDTWALVQARRAPVASYLDLVAMLAPAETGHAVWDELIDQLWFIDHLQRDQPGRERFRAWARALLQPRLKQLDWDPTPGEPALSPRLRSSLIRALGAWGASDVLSEAQRRYQAFLTQPETLAGDLRATILYLAGRNADGPTYDRLQELARREPSTEQRRHLYHALAAARSPELAERTLALAITDELLPTDATSLVGRVAHAGEHPEAAWKFTQSHLDALLAKLASIRANDYVPGLLRAFSDASRADELEKFAASSLPPQAAIAVAKAAEEIRFKAEFRAHLLPELNRWIAGQAGK